MFESELDNNILHQQQPCIKVYPIIILFWLNQFFMAYQ